MNYMGKYGVAKRVFFPLITRGAQDYITTASHAVGDTKVILNEASIINSTNAWTHEGAGIYSLQLTDTEMQNARIVLTIIDQTVPKVWEDQSVVIETYGNASAEHAFDLDTATQDVNVASANANVITSTVIAANAIGATQIAADAITAAKIAANAIGSSELADGTITAAKFGAGAITSTVIASDAIGASQLAANCITTTEVATSVFNQINAECDTALSDIKLQYLVSAALPTGWGTDITSGSALDQMADDGTATFDRTTDSQQAIRDRGDAAYLTATGFSTHTAADVWTAVTRTLTANTNFNDLDAAGIRAAVGLAAADLDTQLAALPTAAENATELLTQANAIETGWTVGDTLRLIAAGIGGKLSGAATTTVTVRDILDVKNRIVATVDADGNRTAFTTLDGT